MEEYLKLKQIKIWKSGFKKPAFFTYSPFKRISRNNLFLERNNNYIAICTNSEQTDQQYLHVQVQFKQS